jgi:N-acetylglucosaminyldiphosphoundecaprenol N-acetyl-beta-D-mannosaminyltransferase
MKKVILGIAIDDISKKEGLIRVGEWVESLKNDPKLVATVGPEFLVTAQTDKDFASTLNEFDLALPEGFGLQLYGQFVNRVPGIEFMLELCDLANDKKWKIGLLGGLKGVAEKASEKLIDKFPGIEIVWSISGEKADLLLQKPDLLKNQQKVDLLFVGFGHPKQEKFLKKAKQEAPRSFNVGVGIGGSLDYIAGSKSQLPRMLAPFGLEWFGRLMTRPAHIFRVWRATVIFPWLLFWSRFRWR